MTAMNVFRSISHISLIRQHTVLVGTVLLASILNLPASSFSVESPAFRLRTNLSTPIHGGTGETQTLAYSTRWDSPESTSISISVLSPSGETTTVLSLTGNQDGQCDWIPTLPGDYTLVHETSTKRSVRFTIHETVTVTFDAEGGIPAFQTQEYLVDETYASFPTAPTKTGYMFNGWYTSTFGGAMVETEDVVTGTQTLYAQWTANKYALTFDGQGGMGASLTATATYGSPMPSIVLPSYPGYTFKGYYTETDGCGTQYYDASGASVRNWDRTSATTLYAAWVPNGAQQPDPENPDPENPTQDPSKPSSSKVTIVFDATGGDGAMGSQPMTLGSSETLPENAFTRQGYVFIGWTTTPGGAVEFTDAASVQDLSTDGGTVTLYAVWAKENYKVKFYANGGKGKMAVEKMKYGKAKRLSKNKFKRDGYKFKGWARSKKLAKKGQIAYKNKKKVKNLTTNGKTVKLYAVWKSR